MNGLSNEICLYSMAGDDVKKKLELVILTWVCLYHVNFCLYSMAGAYNEFNLGLDVAFSHGMYTKYRDFTQSCFGSIAHSSHIF